MAPRRNPLSQHLLFDTKHDSERSATTMEICVGGRDVEEELEPSSKKIILKLQDTRVYKKLFPAGFKQEFKNIMGLSWPVTVTNLFQFLILSESIIMCGHLTKLELDCVALANSIINAVGLSLNTGAVSACDTLFAQCYGSCNKKRMGVILQQGLYILWMFSIIIIAIHLNIEPIFLSLGQIPEVSRMAAEYMTYFAPGLFFHANYIILARYLQNQDIVVPPMVIGFLGNIFNISTQYICIYVFQYRYQASAIVQAASYVVMVVLEVVFILWFKIYEKTWDGWTRKALLDWGQFFSLALPGIAMLSLEVFSWEIGTFIAGYLGETELGAQSILFQVYVMLFQISIGFSVSSNIRVGQCLGAGDQARARSAFSAALLCTGTTATITCIICITLRDYLPMIFTNVPEVIDLASDIYPYLGVFLLMDNITMTCAGCFRGCGRQKVGALFVFIAYYVLGLPVAVALSLCTNMGILGIWIGLMVGLMFSLPAHLWVVLRQDWNEQVEKARIRIKLTPQKNNEHIAPEDGETKPLLSYSRHKRSNSMGTFSTSTWTEVVEQEETGYRHHHRTPSTPLYVSSQQSFVQLRTSPDGEGASFCRLILKRILCYLIAFGLFVIGLLTRILIPPELFRPDKLMNITMTNMGP